MLKYLRRLGKIINITKNYDDVVSKHSSDIILTHLEEMTIDTDPNLPPMTRKPYPLPLIHHKFVKEEIKKMLETVLIEIYMSPYACLIIVLPRKSKPGAPLAGTKRLVKDYCELYNQIPKIHTTQAKLKSSLV